MRGLAGKTAVVTGGSQGIGRATALELASHRVRVAVLDVLPTEEVAEEIRATGTDGIGLKADVRGRAAVEEAAKQIRAALGEPDFLVNNTGGSLAYVPVLELSDELWQDVLALNVTAALNTIRVFCPAMVRAQAGAVVNIGSTAAHFSWPRCSHYQAAKAAVVALTKGVALDLGPSGVRVNSVSPGSVETPGVVGVLSDPDFVTEEADAVALRRIARPAEVAQVVSFLLSDEAEYVTGVDVLCDGGYSLTGQSHRARLALLGTEG
jgi:NAD(P)-dependent dehydrogenase (short-subunit alcohol dehydrogenase family)